MTRDLPNADAALEELFPDFGKEPVNTVTNYAPVALNWDQSGAVIGRAIRYLEKTPIAVDGSNGSAACFRVACVLRKGFMLSTDEALEAIRDWNAACQPPWSEKELRHKLDGAGKASGQSGYLRLTRPEAWQSVKVPEYAEPIEPRLMTVKASDVEPKDLDWLWLSRFLIGHINIIGGDPGLGKSMILIDVAARASTGTDWPDGSQCKRCSVLYSTTEDGIEDTVVPRLIAAGADLDRVHIVEGVKCRDDSEQPLLLNEHLRLLDNNLTENPDIRILIVDTLQSHIGSAVATNNNSSVRGVMTPLKRLAEKHHIAVLCIEHLTKSKTTAGENATYRVQGSIAFAGAARSVWIVAKDQEDVSGKRRFLQASKTNLAPDNSGLGLAYEICGPTGKPVVRWLETDVSTPIDQLLRIPDGSTGDQSEGSELGRCCDWLVDTLVESIAAKDMENGAKSEMISGRTLKRAKEQLGIRSEKRGSVWYWVPPADMEQARTQQLIEAAES